MLLPLIVFEFIETLESRVHSLVISFHFLFGELQKV